jgi:hypothetical protein
MPLGSLGLSLGQVGNIFEDLGGKKEDSRGMGITAVRLKATKESQNKTDGRMFHRQQESTGEPHLDCSSEHPL